jgi:hypothetical protein
MDVISVSLGADTGPADTSDALASTNAANAGVIVVAAAGNAGPQPYVLGDPASGDGVIAAAATDAHAAFPGASVTPVPGTGLVAQDSNGAPLPTTALPVVVLRTTTGAVSLGCNPRGSPASSSWCSAASAPALPAQFTVSRPGRPPWR